MTETGGADMDNNAEAADSPVAGGPSLDSVSGKAGSPGKVF